MVEIDQLPIPDWGLRCPGCDAELAGMRSHRCERCGRAFNIRFLLGMKRPIPHLDLACEQCGYLLTGLMEERCPECGRPFSLREMLEDQSALGALYVPDVADPGDHHLQKREPLYTGRERPLPDFGLFCEECGAPLAGAAAEACPQCGTPFDLSAIIPPGDAWVNITGLVPASLAEIARLVLYDAQVPYLADNSALAQLYGGPVPFLAHPLRVPRAFFFDALHALAAARQPSPAYARKRWICPSCSEEVTAGFEICWNCGAPHPDAPRDPSPNA